MSSRLRRCHTAPGVRERTRATPLALVLAIVAGFAGCGAESSTPASTSGGMAATAPAGEVTGGGPSSSGANSVGGMAPTTGGATSTEATGGATTGGQTNESGGTTGSGGAEPANTAGQPGNATGGSSAGGSGTGGAAPVDDSAELYDPERLPRFDIELPAESIAALDADPDTYVTAGFRYGTETLPNVGIRIKGEGSRRTLEEKAAFKLKFDEFVDDQVFRGLRRLTLNNMVEDPSFLAERLAYHVFRAAGLPAPRCNNALVYVNGDFYGVYANVEAEDKTFLRRWFESDEGNLYEEGQTDFVPGAEAAFDLETNETQNDRTDLANLIDVFQTAEPDTFLEDLGVALDTAHFLRFTAAELVVNQWDMYSYTMFYPNNFRLYSDPTTSRFVFLPWGMDMSMKPFRDSQRKHLPVFGLSRRGDSRTTPISAGLLFQRCLESANCKARYTEAVREVVAVFEAEDLETLAHRYHEQIELDVEADLRKPYSNEQVQSGYQSLLDTIRERPAAIADEL
jgi:spore coat protein CotH